MTKTPIVVLVRLVILCRSRPADDPGAGGEERSRRVRSPTAASPKTTTTMMMMKAAVALLRSVRTAPIYHPATKVAALIVAGDAEFSRVKPCTYQVHSFLPLTLQPAYRHASETDNLRVVGVRSGQLHIF